MRSHFVLLASLSLPCLSSADLLWDTLSGAAGQTTRSSYYNFLGNDWTSVATPVDFASPQSVNALTISGLHLRYTGTEFQSTDPLSDSYTLIAWSSLEAFKASPLSGDLWSVVGTPSVSAAGSNSSGGFPLSNYRFDLTSSLTLPKGRSYLGVYSTSFPVTSGALYWSSTSSLAAPALRVVYTDPASVGTLSNSQALRLEGRALPVPEPTSVLALGAGALTLLRRRKLE